MHAVACDCLKTERAGAGQRQKQHGNWPRPWLTCERRLAFKSTVRNKKPTFSESCALYTFFLFCDIEGSGAISTTRTICSVQER